MVSSSPRGCAILQPVFAVTAKSAHARLGGNGLEALRVLFVYLPSA